jgi:hypothetical protein
VKSSGWVGLSQVNGAHTQRIMFNGVINPPLEFEYSSRRYYRVKEVRKYEFVVATYGTTSVPNLIDFRRAIL